MDTEKAKTLAQAETELNSFLNQLMRRYGLNLSELLGAIELVKWDIINSTSQKAELEVMKRKLR
jgi:hypothetical protein